MICPKCNAQIPDDARECPKCHFHQTFTEPLDFSARNERTIESKQKFSAPSISAKNVMFIMIAILLLAIVIAVYYLLNVNGAEADAAARVLPSVFGMLKL